MDILGWNVPVWLLLILVLFLLWLRQSTARYGTFKKLGIPGPRPIPPIGTLYVFGRSKQGMLSAHLELYQKYKSNVIGTFMGRIPALVMYDLEAARQVMVKDFSNFTDRQVADFGDKTMNRMMTMLQGEHWKTVRHLVSPAFSGSKLRKMTKSINECGHILVKNLKVPAKAGDAFECKEYTGSYTMDVISRTAFSIDIDTQNDKNNAFVRAAKTMMAQSLFSWRLMVMFFFPYLIPYLSKYFGFSVFDIESLDFFRDITERAMKERAENPNEAPKDFLQMMMTSELDDQEGHINDNPESDIQTDMTGQWSTKGLMKDDIVGQCVVFFLAGYNTVADTLAFTMYHLALYPEVQEKVYQEIIDVLPDGGDLGYDQAKKLTYTQMCIDETLRLYPPAPMVDRKCIAETVINGTTIPKDVLVHIPIHAFQNDPSVWEEPEKFDPERFTEEAKAARHPFQYMPFGLGPRMCVAQRLAMLKAKIGLVHIIRNFRLLKCDKTEIPLKMRGTRISPVNGTWLKLEERN